MVFILLRYGATSLKGVRRFDTACLTHLQGSVLHWVAVLLVVVGPPGPTTTNSTATTTFQR
jgi:hypothetical protein